MYQNRSPWSRFLAIALVLACARCWAGEGPPGQVIPAVSVEPATTLTGSQPKTFIGTVTGSETVSIVARISGTLWKASFREGSLVRKGDVLFEIEDTIYKANVSIAEALIAQTEAELQLAVKDHERNSELLKSKAISTQSFDTTYATMKLREAKVEEAKASLILALHDLEQCHIVSPISGRVGEKQYSEGNYITPTTGVLAVVVQYQPINVQFPMSESDFFRYFDGHDQLRSVELSVIRANGQRYEGSLEVDFVDNTVDRRTDTIMIQLKCDNPADQLLPGGFVQVQVSEKYEKPVPAVSTSALMTDGVRHYVYVVGADDVVQRRDVVLGDLVRLKQAITSGLEPGERVVVGGMNKTAPGGKVQPVVLLNN